MTFSIMTSEPNNGDRSPTTSLSSPLQSSALSQSLSSSRAGTETESSFTPTTQPAGPNASSKSSHTPVIAGSVIAGTLLILTVVLLLWRYKTKSRIHSSSTPRTNDNSQVSNLEIEPYKLKEQHISTLYSSHARPQSVVGGNEARNSVHSTITITSALTERQVQLRDETEALREQMKILQQAVVSSNVELQREIGRMGAHIRRLESVWNSDWARGLSDDPPPHYES
ncbi:hypothetical protein K435DRAFT_428403 [Dendrothele bispora CBS 962.96]|uniref:Uncharacterized protein n=1 Tax=Dendrothele bispora (strain CBS 962.96) TaxID=1314807 RepID=A0A4S8L484_DENBC|nr:hypothetical protein K435DRAFT_428403 [Dendrothele bispora CBS 962.96]